MEFGIWYYQIYIISFLCSFNTSPPESQPLPKIANNKKNPTFNQESFRKSVSKLKSKKPYF